MSSINPPTIAALVFIGQLVFALLRTVAVRQIAASNKKQVVFLNAICSLIRLLTMAGGVTSVVNSDWLAVLAYVVAGMIGDYLAMSSIFHPKEKK